jgi:hypothetical protein
MVSIEESMRGMCGDGFTTFTKAEIEDHNRYVTSMQYSDNRLDSRIRVLNAMPIETVETIAIPVRNEEDKFNDSDKLPKERTCCSCLIYIKNSFTKLCLKFFQKINVFRTQ